MRASIVRCDQYFKKLRLLISWFCPFVFLIFSPIRRPYLVIQVLVLSIAMFFYLIIFCIGDYNNVVEEEKHLFY